MSDSKPKKMAIISAQGTLDAGYPPLILASTAAALDMEVMIFFTFYGIELVKKKSSLRIAPQTNPSMPMKMPFGPKWFQNINIPIPNFIMGNVPGFESISTSLMKKSMKNKGIATILELRDACIESGVKMLVCTMAMDLFGYKEDDFIDGVEFGGASYFIDYASDADIQLFM